MSVTILDHPIAHDAIRRLRDKSTSVADFRAQLHRLSLILATEATSDLGRRSVRVSTPLADTEGHKLANQHALIPVMRAGHGMLDAFLAYLPGALVWHLSMSRSHEPPFDPIFTDSKVPEEITGPVGTCFLLDPMLATAGSACFAVQHLKDSGASRIVFVGVLGCWQGVERLQEEHPDVNIVIGAVDEVLNEHAYIVPGLGDAGDRLYPTQ